MIILLSGLALMAAGLFLLARSHLLSGRVRGWPGGPLWLRFVLFSGGLCLTGEGIVLIRHPAAAAFCMAGTAFVVLAVELSLLINLWRQRAPKGGDR